MRTSLDGYGSKIRKVSRCRRTVSNETILATKQEFFFTIAAPVQSITNILLLGFFINTAPWNVYFILNYHLFFRKEFYFSNVYISVNTIFEYSYLSFGWEIGHPLSLYVTRGMEGGGQKCVKVRTGGEGYYASCVCTHLHCLFSCLCRIVSCFICRN